jgi:hypothetical protein
MRLAECRSREIKLASPFKGAHHQRNGSGSVATHPIIHDRRDFSERVGRKRHIAKPGIQKNTAFNMYRPDAISSTPPAVSKKRRCDDSPRKFSSHPIATAPSTSGTARPMPNAKSSTTPRTTEPSCRQRQGPRARWPDEALPGPSRLPKTRPSRERSTPFGHKRSRSQNRHLTGRRRERECGSNQDLADFHTQRP